ncbi:hypothetical protein L598_000700000620 [Mesorhizobium sp. J18]|nr:hypothetical protein L598_000700000620 [Mesorhizobium sp. J18]
MSDLTFFDAVFGDPMIYVWATVTVAFYFYRALSDG